MKKPSSDLKPVGKDEDDLDDDLGFGDDGADDGECDGHEGEDEDQDDHSDGHGDEAEEEEQEKMCIKQRRPCSRFVLGQADGEDFYVDAGYPRIEAWNLAQADWMVSPHRAA